MENSKFTALIGRKEGQYLDYKIKCDAFNSKDIKPNAELVKDICAMSNNGNKLSYIIIGISDDRKDFLSVLNDGLNDDNLQTICKTSIEPPPNVKLYRGKFLRRNSKHAKKEFVVIEIGQIPKLPIDLQRILFHIKKNVVLEKTKYG
jgi:predicted HTH transcriptional regulator